MAVDGQRDDGICGDDLHLYDDQNRQMWPPLATLQIAQGGLECVGGLVFALAPGDVPGGGSDAIMPALFFVGLGGLQWVCCAS
jgi:hypothetical protein